MEGDDTQIPGPNTLDEQPDARSMWHSEDEEPQQMADEGGTPQNEGDDEGQGTKASSPIYHNTHSHLLSSPRSFPTSRGHQCITPSW